MLDAVERGRSPVHSVPWRIIDAELRPAALGLSKDSGIHGCYRIGSAEGAGAADLA